MGVRGVRAARLVVWVVVAGATDAAENQVARDLRDLAVILRPSGETRGRRVEPSCVICRTSLAKPRLFVVPLRVPGAEGIPKSVRRNRDHARPGNPVPCGLRQLQKLRYRGPVLHMYERRRRSLDE